MPPVSVSSEAPTFTCKWPPSPMSSHDLCPQVCIPSLLLGHKTLWPNSWPLFILSTFPKTLQIQSHSGALEVRILMSGFGGEQNSAQASLVAQLVKNPPAMQETWVRSLGWNDPLEKGKATHSSILAWRIPQTLQSMRSQRVKHDWATFTSLQNSGHNKGLLSLDFLSLCCTTLT